MLSVKIRTLSSVLTISFSSTMQIYCFNHIFTEEVLSQDNAIWWAPDGNHFLFASFNDSLIGLYDLTYYGDMKNQYVENKRLLYPKVNKFFKKSRCLWKQIVYPENCKVYILLRS